VGCHTHTQAPSVPELAGWISSLNTQINQPDLVLEVKQPSRGRRSRTTYRSTGDDLCVAHCQNPKPITQTAPTEKFLQERSGVPEQSTLREKLTRVAHQLPRKTAKAILKYNRPSVVINVGRWSRVAGSGVPVSNRRNRPDPKARNEYCLLLIIIFSYL
jgi:hypothetical protein